MSSRGETVFVSTWGSRGSALANKVAFQRIATSNENHVFLAMRLFLHLRYKTLDLLQIHFFYSIYPYCLRAIKSFDREGWVVGVAVRYTSNILQQVGGNTTKSSRGVAFFLQWRFCEIPTSQKTAPRDTREGRSWRSPQKARLGWGHVFSYRILTN